MAISERGGYFFPSERKEVVLNFVLLGPYFHQIWINLTGTL
jgi:hypothetical protein